MNAYELVTSSRWSGVPSQYPEVHARALLAPRRGRPTDRERASLCGLAREVRPVPVDPYAALVDQVTCRRCARMLERVR